MEYTAFLSYSQTADSRIARKLQTAVHRIAIPWYQKRVVNIFLDKTSLSAHPALWPRIQETLDNSKHFFLLASRKAAKSEWVSKELLYWLGNNPKEKSQRLYIVLTDGNIAWNEKDGDFDWESTDALPPRLSGVFEFEPLYVDLRWAKKKHYSHSQKLQFQDAIASLAAPLRELPKEDLFNRETRLQKIAKRLVSYAAALFFALMVASGYLSYIANRKAEENRSLALASSARMVLGEGNTDLAIALALQAMRTSYPVKVARKALAEAAFFSPGTRRCYDHNNNRNDPITSVDVNRNGDLLASGSEGGIARLWSLESEVEKAQLAGHTGAITKVTFRPPDCRQILTASMDGSMRLWDIDNQKAVRVFSGHSGGVTSAIFSEDGTTIVSGGKDHRVRIWDTETGDVIRYKNLQQDEVNCLAVRTGDNRIAFGSPDNNLYLWDLSSDTLRKRKNMGTWGITDLAFLPDHDPDKGSLLVGTGGYPKEINIQLVDTSSFKTIRKYRGNSGGTCISVLHKGTGFLSGTYDNAVRFWDIGNDIFLHRYLGHKDDVTDIAFFHNGKAFVTGSKAFVTGSKDGTLRLWDLASPAQHAAYSDQRYGPFAPSPDGRTIISGHEKLSMWTMDSVEKPIFFHDSARYAQCVAFSPDGTKAVSGSIYGEGLVWDIATRRLVLMNRKIHPARMVCVATANWPAGQTVVLSGSYQPKNYSGLPRNDLLVLWELNTGRILRRLVGHEASIAAIDINKNGTRAVSGSNDKRIIVWDLLSGKPIHHLDGHSDKVTGVVLGPNERFVLSTSFDQTVRLWDVKTEKEIRRYPGHTLAVTCIDFKPHRSRELDRSLIVTGSDDRTIRVWDMDSGEELARLIGHTRKLRDVLFMPDQENRLISLGWDDTIRAWEIRPPMNLKQWTHENRYIPKLSEAQKRRYGIED